MMKTFFVTIFLLASLLDTNAQYSLLGSNQGTSTTDSPSFVSLSLTQSNLQTQTNTITGLGTTTLPGLQLTNTTAAAAGAQQVSPSIKWTGQGWKTTATAASQSVEFQSNVTPVQGSTTPTGLWNLSYSINGGAAASAMAVSTTGTIGIIATNIFGSAMNADGSAAGNPYWNMGNSSLDFKSTLGLRWSSTAAATGTVDTGLSRNAAGVGEVNNGTLGTFRDWKVRTLISDSTVRLKGFTVATLPASPTQGDTTFVTDATAPTYLGTLTGGGAVVTPVFYNGTAWVSH